jgi:hypothetical protein
MRSLLAREEHNLDLTEIETAVVEHTLGRLRVASFRRRYQAYHQGHGPQTFDCVMNSSHTMGL